MQIRNGGVGKTTTALSLGVALKKEGKRVLLLDSDPQADLTDYMGYYNKETLQTISTLMDQFIDKKEITTEQAILHHTEGIDLIPSNIELAMVDANLPTVENREKAMSIILENVKNKYDYIIIDCMPSLTMLTTNALATADEVIIPVQSQYLSAKGMGNLLNTISEVRRQINKNLQVGGILLTLVDTRTKLPSIIKQELEENYGNIVKIYNTQIPYAIKTAESTSRGKSIFKYDKSGKVANAYENFAKEVLKDDRERRKNALAKSKCL